MPPASAAKRRRTGQNAASTKAAQSQLSFRSAKSNRNKPEVEYEPDTKPIKPAKPEVTIKDDSISEPSVDEVKPQASTEPEVALGADVETDSEDDDDDDVEARARAVTQKQIDAYWRKKEEDRLAPRVHQQKLSKTEKILREFDLTGSYGVSDGFVSKSYANTDSDPTLA